MARGVKGMARGARGVGEDVRGRTTPCIYVIVICAGRND
jgi:hypothetical protein